jgi:hypothetical protein
MLQFVRLDDLKTKHVYYLLPTMYMLMELESWNSVNGLG